MSAISLVKKRMAEMRDGIDEAEVRTKDAVQLKREAEARGYSAESQATSLRNRVSQVLSDIEKIQKTLDNQTTNLGGAEGRTEEHDTVRKDLEGRETDSDQDLVLTEQTLKDTKVMVTENTQKYDDAVNKFKVLEQDLERVCERLTNAQNKVETLEGKASQVNTDLKDLEVRDEEASERETSLEDNLRHLESQMKETEQRADHAERIVAKLERFIEIIKGSIELEQKKLENANDELEATMNELLGIQ